MLFVLIAHDKPEALDLRKATRQAHLDYWLAAGNATFGGPLLGADGNPFGSILVIEAESEGAARKQFEADPYVTTGLFEMTRVSAFRHVLDKGALIA